MIDRIWRMRFYDVLRINQTILARMLSPVKSLLSQQYKLDAVTILFNRLPNNGKGKSEQRKKQNPSYPSQRQQICRMREYATLWQKRWMTAPSWFMINKSNTTLHRYKTLAYHFLPSWVPWWILIKTDYTYVQLPPHNHWLRNMT